MSARAVVDLGTLAAQQPFDESARAARHVNRIALHMMQIEDARIAARRQALDEAYAERKKATDAAYERGYREGTHWGMFCGWVAGLIFAGVAIGAWQALRPSLLELLLRWAPQLVHHTGLMV